jgi:hypothetical protein
MRSHNGIFAVLAFVGALSAGGCTLFTGPKSHPITMSVTSDTLVAGVRPAGDVTWLQFTIPVSIHNGNSAPLTVDVCLASVEDPNGTIVWAPICFLEGVTSPTIAPGATQTYQWSVMAAVSGPGNPKWGSQTIDGTYRLRLAIDADEAVLSNAFAVSVLTVSAASSH